MKSLKRSGVASAVKGNLDEAFGGSREANGEASGETLRRLWKTLERKVCW